MVLKYSTFLLRMLSHATEKITIAMVDMLLTHLTMVSLKDLSEKKTSHGLAKTLLALILKIKKDKMVIKQCWLDTVQFKVLTQSSSKSLKKVQ